MWSFMFNKHILEKNLCNMLIYIATTILSPSGCYKKFLVSLYHIIEFSICFNWGGNKCYNSRKVLSFVFLGKNLYPMHLAHLVSRRICNTLWMNSNITSNMFWIKHLHDNYRFQVHSGHWSQRRIDEGIVYEIKF